MSVMLPLTLARTPTQKLTIRRVMATYMAACEKNQALIHYSEHRPTQIGLNPAIGGTTDCSGYFINICYWAQKQTMLFIPDPSGFHYSGYGNTDYIWANNHMHSAPVGKYLIGDFVIYGRPAWGETVHMMVCKKAGTKLTSLWSSHGEESGPEERHLADDTRPVVGIFRLATLL
jgi:hypothetical protein